MRIVNAPGRFDRSPRALGIDVRRWTELAGRSIVFAGCSVVFFTEVNDPGRAAVLKADGWTTTHVGTKPGAGECAIMTRDAARRVIAVRSVKLTDGGGKRRLSKPIYAPVVVTVAPSGRKTLLTNAHLPAHIEGIWAVLPDRLKFRLLEKRPNLSPAIRTWLEAVTNWRAKVTHLAAEHHVDDVVVAPDWNLDANKQWVQDLMARLWPGLNVQHTRAPDLGKRNVGWVMTNMRMASGRVHKSAASDHDAGEFELKHLNPAPAAKPKTDPTRPPPPFEHVIYNGALMDQKTKTAVQLGEKRLGYPLTILQGCYHPGVSQSAGTHDGGQVIDFAPYDFARKVRKFRDMGWFIWHRLPIPGVWGEHIHGGIRNGGTLSPSAKAQQADYDGTPPRDGLADHAVDNTYHPDPPATFDYAAAWRELNG